jgi:Hypervirulence associated proteins TUDOR domain
MPKKLSPGDKVRWNTSQGETEGEVKERVTEETQVGGTRLKGSADDPVYIVESAKTGKQAGHKAKALRRKS